MNKYLNLLSDDSKTLIRNLKLYKINETYFKIPDIIYNWSNDIIMMYSNLLQENKLLEHSEIDMNEDEGYFDDSYPKVIETIKYLYETNRIFLHNIITKNYNDPTEIINFIEDIINNKLSVDELYEWINGDGKKLIKEINNIMYDGEIDENIENNIYTYRNIYSQFCPVEIQQYIEKKLKKNNKFKVVLPNSGSIDNLNTNNILLNLNLVTNEEIMQFPLKYEKVDTIAGINPLSSLNLSFIITRCLLIHGLHSANINNRVINLYLYTTPFKKLTISMNNSLGPMQINSAVQHRDTIVIYRQEELMKSILHESIHHAYLDNRLDDDNKVQNYIKTHMAISESAEIRVYEAFTETFANIFNVILTIFEMIIYKQDNLKTHHYLLEKFITMEQIFACFQAAKILKFYGFTSFEEFLNPRNTNKRLHQDTSVLSYHILKGGFITSLDIFMEKYNPEIVDLSIKLTSDDYIELIKKCVIENKYYHEFVNFFIMKFKVEDQFTELSLRMTLLELTTNHPNH